MAEIDQQFARMLALVEQCARLPESERTSWLEREVRDEDLRIEIELMLAADVDQIECVEREVFEHIDLFSTESDIQFEHVVAHADHSV